jgi:uncharacterized membrane protein
MRQLPSSKGAARPGPSGQVHVEEVSAMQPFGGTVLKTSLSDADEKELAEELTGQG